MITFSCFLNVYVCTWWTVSMQFRHMFFNFFVKLFFSSPWVFAMCDPFEGSFHVIFSFLRLAVDACCNCPCTFQPCVLNQGLSVKLAAWWGFALHVPATGSCRLLEQTKLGSVFVWAWLTCLWSLSATRGMRSDTGAVLAIVSELCEACKLQSHFRGRVRLEED